MFLTILAWAIIAIILILPATVLVAYITIVKIIVPAIDNPKEFVYGLATLAVVAGIMAALGWAFNRIGGA